MREILKLSESLFSSWESENICYCHWKSNEHLYEGLVGETDLDILVKPADKDRAEPILVGKKFIKCRSQYGSTYDMVDDWLGCDYASGKLIHIHLHYKMITGHKGLKEFDLPWTELALRTRVRHHEFPIYVIDPNLEILVLLSRLALKSTLRKNLKAKLGKVKLSASDEREIRYLQDRVDRQTIRAIAEDSFGKDAEGITELALSTIHDTKWFLELKKTVSRNLKKTNRYGYSTFVMRPVSYAAIYFRILLKKKYKSYLFTRKTLKKGAIIAFIGQDGSGKSAVSDEVCKWLSWKLEAMRFYLGSGEGYSSWQKRLRGMMKKNKGLSRAGRNLLTISDLQKIARVTYKKVKIARKYADQGGIAIVDRYPQIQFEGINDGPKIRSHSAGLKLGKLIARVKDGCADREEMYLRKAAEISPDLVFKLIISPEESLRRKPMEKIENIRSKHEIVKNLGFDDSTVILIDAEQDFSQELREIHAAIWDYCFKING